MRRLIFISFLLLILSFPSSAKAQTNVIQIDHVLVNIWAEYDRPDVLIIYHITLSPTTSLPAKMFVRIPSESVKPHAVAYQGFDGVLYDLKYETVQDGNWLQVTFTTESDEIQIEYYDPTIKRDLSNRSYTYQWNSDYPVNSITVDVVQPVNATQFQINPEMGSGLKNDDGLVHYTLVLNNIKANSPMNIQINYEKADDTLSSSYQVVQPSKPIPTTTASSEILQNLLPWVWIALGLLLIGGGVFAYIRLGQKDNPRSAGRRRHTPANLEKAAASDAVYCHHCGKSAQSGDVFCRSCGTKIRYE